MGRGFAAASREIADAAGAVKMPTTAAQQQPPAAIIVVLMLKHLKACCRPLKLLEAD